MPVLSSSDSIVYYDLVVLQVQDRTAYGRLRAMLRHAGFMELWFEARVQCAGGSAPVRLKQSFRAGESSVGPFSKALDSRFHGNDTDCVSSVIEKHARIMRVFSVRFLTGLIAAPIYLAAHFQWEQVVMLALISRAFRWHR